MARRAARRMALPRKGPWIYDYGSLEQVLGSLYNWGMGVKLTRQAWERYTLVDPTQPLQYCEITGYKRAKSDPMKPTYSMKYYKGEKLMEGQRTVRKADWRVLREDDLVLARNRECMGALADRRREEGWTGEDIKEMMRKKKEEEDEKRKRMEEELLKRAKEHFELAEEKKKKMREDLATFWKNRIEEISRRRSEAKERRERGDGTQNDGDIEVKQRRWDVVETKEGTWNILESVRDMLAELKKEGAWDVASDWEERVGRRGSEEKGNERQEL